MFRTHLKTRPCVSIIQHRFYTFPPSPRKLCLGTMSGTQTPNACICVCVCVCMLTSARAFSSPSVRAPSSGSPYRNTHTYAHFGTKISVATQETFVLYPRPVGCHPQRSALGLQPVAFLCQVRRSVSGPFLAHSLRIFRHFPPVFTVWTPGFQRVRPKGQGKKRGENREEFGRTRLK